MFEVSRKYLADALRNASKVSPKHTSIPLLKCVHIIVDKDSLTLHATNLEQHLVEVMPIIGSSQPANACVPLIQLASIINSYLHDDVQLDVHPGHVTIGATKVPSLSPDDFPARPRVNIHATVELPDGFNAGLRFVKSAVSDEPARHVLQALLFDFTNGNLVASDGTRLHLAKIWQPSKHGKLIIPPSAFNVDTATAIGIPKPNGEAKQVSINLPNARLYTSTMDGHWPDYTQILREDHTLTAVVDREELLVAVEQCLPVLTERVNACTLHVNKHLEVSAKNDTAECSNHIAAHVEGNKLTVNVNAHKLLDTLRTIPGEAVVLAFRKPEEAIHIYSEDERYRAVIMPLNRPG